MKKLIILLATFLIAGIVIWLFISSKKPAPSDLAQNQTPDTPSTNPESTLRDKIEQVNEKSAQEISKITEQQKENGCIKLQDVEVMESETGNKTTEKQWRTVSHEGICNDLMAQKNDLQKQRSSEIDKLQREADLLTARSEQERTKAIQAIRDFMANPNLELEYIATRSPSNFNVGIKKETYGNNPAISTGSTMETPKEWERKTEIYQQKEYINGTCEVYEYEIDPRNNQIIQVSIRYPQEGIIVNPKEQKDCANSQSLETPLLTLPELKEIAMNYAKKGVNNFEEIKNDFVYQASTENPKTIPAQNTWLYQNKDYKLPDGLTAQEPSPYPTIWATITSGGHLLWYLNTTGLFQ